jgi:hypothetical protein
VALIVFRTGGAEEHEKSARVAVYRDLSGALPAKTFCMVRAGSHGIVNGCVRNATE